MSLDNVADYLLKLGFPVLSVLVLFNSVGTLNYEDVDLSVLRDFSWFQMTVLFSRVVSCVQDLDSVYLDQEQSSSENVARSVSCELDSLVLALLMVVNRLDLLQRARDVC